MTVLFKSDLEFKAGSEGRITSVGQIFNQGDVPSGSTLSARFGDSDVPLQVDIKATWPDGSIKHAVLSFANPDTISAEPAELSFSVLDHPEPAASADIDVAAMALAQGYDFEVEIDGEIIDVAALLAEQEGDVWLSGPLAGQVRVTASTANGLDLRFDITARADGTLETSVIVGNDNILTTGLEAVTYAYAIRQNGVEVLANAALTQPHFTVWRETFSTEAAPNTAHVIYDIDYLRSTGLMPAVDAGLPLTDANEYYDRLIADDATFDPLELGGIDNRGGIDDDRGRTGDSPSYGLLTDDQHSYLVTQTAETREAMLALTDQYGAYSNYYRNPETGEAYQIEDMAFDSFRTETGNDLPGTDGVIDRDNDGLAGRNRASHDPSEYYLSYLVTGDRYYADGLAHEAGAAQILWANGTYLTERGAVDFSAQLREQAWVLRDLFYGASLSPDGSHASEVLNARLEGALQDYLDYYVNRDVTLQNRLGSDLSGARSGARFVDGELEGVLQSFNGTAIDRPYWQDWFGMVVGQIAATGNERAIALGEWMANFSAGRFLQDDFDPSHNLYSIVNYPAGGSNDLPEDVTWAGLQEAALAVGAVGADVNPWSGSGFYAAASWGGTTAMFSGVRDARFGEALLWMSHALTDEYVTTYMIQGSAAQFSIPVTFADGSTAGVFDRSNGTELADAITDGDGARIINAGDGDDIVITGEGSHLVEGGDGADILIGGGGEDWLYGGSGADTLTGGAGWNYLQGDRHDADFGRFADTFRFEATLGETIIGDFTIGQDQLALDGFDGFRTVEEVLALFEATPEGAVLDLADAGRLTLENVAPESLTAADIVLSNVPNIDPTAVNDALAGAKSGETVNIEAAMLLGNDGDADGDDLRLSDVSNAIGGTVSQDNGAITFVIANDFVGSASFTYEVSDGFGGFAEAQATFEVAPNAPTIAAITNVITGPGWLRGTSGNDHIIPTEDNVRVFGRAGDDLIDLFGYSNFARGNAGDDVIVMHNRNQGAWGGGGADDFVIAGPRVGATIRDFDLARDTLYFANGIGGMVDFDAVLSVAVEYQHGVRIATEAGHVRLYGVALEDLHEEMFGFYSDAPAPISDFNAPVTGALQTGPGWLDGGVENDLIASGQQNIRITGGFGDDHLIAQHWNVRMQGGAGDDLLEARAHDAILYGDAGADTFYFVNRLDGRLMDFEATADRVAIDAGMFGFEKTDDLVDALQQGETGAYLEGNDGDILTFENISAEALSVDNFVLV